MVRRSGTRGEFWGCTRFKADGCTGTRPVTNGAREPASRPGSAPAPCAASPAPPVPSTAPAPPTDARPAGMVADLRRAAQHVTDALTEIQKWRPELCALMADPF